MPWGDRMGPVGAGPRTGRGLGFCNGYASPGYLNSGFGRGFGFGARRGFGFEYNYGYFPANLSKDDEKNILENEISRLTSTIDSLRKRLDELKD